MGLEIVKGILSPIVWGFSIDQKAVNVLKNQEVCMFNEQTGTELNRDPNSFKDFYTTTTTETITTLDPK